MEVEPGKRRQPKARVESEREELDVEVNLSVSQLKLPKTEAAEAADRSRGSRGSGTGGSGK